MANTNQIQGFVQPLMMKEKMSRIGQIDGEDGRCFQKNIPEIPLNIRRKGANGLSNLLPAPPIFCPADILPQSDDEATVESQKLAHGKLHLQKRLELLGAKFSNMMDMDLSVGREGQPVRR